MTGAARHRRVDPLVLDVDSGGRSAVDADDRVIARPLRAA